MLLVDGSCYEVIFRDNLRPTAPLCALLAAPEHHSADVSRWSDARASDVLSFMYAEVEDLLPGPTRLADDKLWYVKLMASDPKDQSLATLLGSSRERHVSVICSLVTTQFDLHSFAFLTRSATAEARRNASSLITDWSNEYLVTEIARKSIKRIRTNAKDLPAARASALTRH